jgi:hypothetical protein
VDTEDKTLYDFSSVSSVSSVVESFMVESFILQCVAQR